MCPDISASEDSKTITATADSKTIFGIEFETREDIEIDEPANEKFCRWFHFGCDSACGREVGFDVIDTRQLRSELSSCRRIDILG